MDIKWKDRARQNMARYKKFLATADQKKLIRHLTSVSEQAYKKVDCLSCASCCKNYSPRFKAPDIKRISKYLGMKETAFMDSYLYIDNEGDQVLKQKPCPFLEESNHCSIYEMRPSDCHRFPYTDEDVFLKKKELSLKNISFCPIAYHTIELLMDIK